MSEQTVSTHKTVINEEVVKDLLNREFNGELSNLEFISGGESSQAFSLNTGSEDYIIRVNNHNPDGFIKDEYAFKHFSSTGISIPEVIKIGQMDNGYYFCISKKAEGQLLEKFTEPGRLEIIPALLQTLDKIHAIDVSDKHGYGKWDGGANGPKATWREAILCVDEYVWGGEGRASYFETTFLNKELWERGYERLEELIQYCPEERYLAHGDAGFDNVLSDGKEITAVIDWADSRYGDFLFDAAWLSFWCIDDAYGKICREYYAERAIPNFEERLTCYQIFIALNSLSFYAYSGQEMKAEFPTSKLKNLLSR
jgi:hygromycin-B 4-O-kinase